MIKAGAAKRCINPTGGMMPYPSFNREPYTDIYSDVNMRAVVIDNGAVRVLILGYDMGGVPDPESTKAMVEKEFGIAKEHILLTATHNHTGCDMVFDPAPEKQAMKKLYMDMVMEKTREAVKEAIESMRPARYGYGEGKSYVNGNRDMATELGTFTQGYEPEGYCDRTIYTIKLVGEDQKLIAAIVNYGMHATLAYFDVDVDGRTKVSGNIPGVAAEYVEERFEGSVCLWTSGAAGDQNPYTYCMRDYEKDGFPSMARLIPGMQYNLIRIMGKQHGVDICRAINSICHFSEHMPMSFGQTSIDLPAQTFAPDVDMQWVNDITNHIYPMKPGEKLPEPILTPDQPKALYIQNMVLGDIALVGIAAEIYALIGKMAREASPYRKTMVVTHCHDNRGYIIDKTSVDHFCFEQFGPYQAGVCDEKIAEGVRGLFDRMMGEQV